MSGKDPTSQDIAELECLIRDPYVFRLFCKNHIPLLKYRTVPTREEGLNA